jgi:predicted transcriptional regulator
MIVKELAEYYGLKVAAGAEGLDREVSRGYCGDLLSDVMANAPIGCVWLTVQGHQNIVAVALTGGREPEPQTVARADAERIPILVWPHSSFELAGKLYVAGVDSRPSD